MKPIRVKPVEIIGSCPINITKKDEFVIEGLQIKNPNRNKLCFLAISHLYYGIWGIQGNQVLINHTSCPGCITEIEEENRVSFRLGYKEHWELGKIITNYYSLLKNYSEPENAKKLRLAAEEHLFGEKMNYKIAFKTMKLAIKIMKSCTGLEPAIKVV